MADFSEFKCPNCSGAIRFDSHTQKVICPYCDTEFDPDAFKQAEEDYARTDYEDEMQWEGMRGADWQRSADGHLRIFVCNSCGGELVTDETTAAASCPYCGNPVVLSENVAGLLEPEYIMPFQLDKDAAIEKLNEHLSGKKLLPKAFKDQQHIEEIKGIYVPFWLYDTTADARVNYKATRVRTWQDRDFIYTETKFYNVFRAGTMRFEKVPADASKRMPDDLMDSIEPFDWNALTGFKMAYLAGFFADRYDVTAAEDADRVNRRIRQSTEDAIRRTVQGYATVTQEGSQVAMRGETASYALLPVWMLTTRWNDESYIFAMNGQTGKFVGDLPMDKGVMWKQFFLTFAIAAVIVIVVALLATGSSMSVIAGIIVGFVIALIRILVMRGKLKSVHDAKVADAYVEGGGVHLTEHRDVFLYHTVTKTPKPKENNGGGHGGGHGGPGGPPGGFGGPGGPPPGRH